MPYIEDMKNNLAQALSIQKEQISIKAKTHEKLDSVGECCAIEANCVVLVEWIT